MFLPPFGSTVTLYQAREAEEESHVESPEKKHIKEYLKIFVVISAGHPGKSL